MIFQLKIYHKVFDFLLIKLFLFDLLHFKNVNEFVIINLIFQILILQEAVVRSMFITLFRIQFNSLFE